MWCNFIDIIEWINYYFYTMQFKISIQFCSFLSLLTYRVHKRKERYIRWNKKATQNIVGLADNALSSSDSVDALKIVQYFNAFISYVDNKQLQQYLIDGNCNIYRFNRSKSGPTNFFLAKSKNMSGISETLIGVVKNIIQDFRYRFFNIIKTAISNRRKKSFLHDLKIMILNGSVYFRHFKTCTVLFVFRYYLFFCLWAIPFKEQFLPMNVNVIYAILLSFVPYLYIFFFK